LPTDGAPLGLFPFFNLSESLSRNPFLRLCQAYPALSLKTLPTSLRNLKRQAYRGDKKIINGILGIEKSASNREKKRKNSAGSNIAEGRFTMQVLTIAVRVFHLLQTKVLAPVRTG
jgi:hypothetical protein